MVRMIEGLFYPLCKERAKELKLCSVKKRKFRADTINMILCNVYKYLIGRGEEEIEKGEPCFPQWWPLKVSEEMVTN